jgi:YegS/Rv2252/BmrU family lipid kinase
LRIQVIINPIAGVKNKEGLADAIVERLSPHQVGYVYTQGPKHATQLAQDAVAAKADVVAVVGGDGTINEAAQALVDTSVTLALLPSGSGNGLARHLRIPLDPLEALTVIQRGRTCRIDTAQIHEQIYLCAAGVGFDAEVAWSFSRQGFRGFFSYLYAAFKKYMVYKPQIYALAIDGKKRQVEAFLIVFANGSQFGSGAVIAPEARIDDGYLDIVILKRFPFYALPKIVFQLFRGTLHRSSHVEIILCKEIALTQGSFRAHIDGEPLHCTNGLRSYVRPASLSIYY